MDFVENYAEIIEKSVAEGQVVIISNNQDHSMVKMLCKLHRQGHHFLWIVPVANTQDYKVVPELKGYMRMWRMNFEAAKEGKVI